MEQQLNNISQELAGLQLQYFKWKNEISALLEGFRASKEASLQMIAELENRVKVLEEARQKQIQLNQELFKRPEVKIDPIKVKSFWDLFN